MSGALSAVFKAGAAVAFAAVVASTGVTGTAIAQVGPDGAINPSRDCQTIRTCRFKKGGDFRGCISTFSCRVCRFVTARCRIAGKSQNCRRLRCSWGG